MASALEPAHRAGMAEIILLVFTGLAFLVLLAAVPMELDEERRDERAREAHARRH
jgi:hypothetical protein